MVFTSFSYRIAIFILMPVILVGIGVYTGRRWGELGMIASAMLLTMTEVISDHWLFSGLQAKEAEKMDFLKTSGWGMEILRDALILDLLRKFLMDLVVLMLCSLIVGLLESISYIVFVSYTCSVLGTFLARYWGKFATSMWIGEMGFVFVGLLLGVFFTVLKQYMFWMNLFFLVLGMLLSVLAVEKVMRKVKGGYYDE